MTAKPSRWWRRSIRGMQIGLAFAVAFSSLAIVYYVLSGSDAFQRQTGMSLPKAILGYIYTGITAGAIAGALTPFAKSASRAAVVGVIAALPVALGVWIFVCRPRGMPDADGIRVSILVAVVLGIVGGVTQFRIYSRTPKNRRQP